MEELQKCDNEQMVLVNVPIPKETLGTTVGFKIEVNDFGNFTETKQDAESDECTQEVTITLNDDSNSDTQISWNDSDSSDILNQDTVKQEFSSTVSVKEEITSNGECSEEESSKYNMCEVSGIRFVTQIA
ncbi:uncharacterized protein LOC114365387 [Ostrinia furnacalis]|uniref:uncharacterized protein LOC114365387 n=1 Tax=Ostrinia furnacalis TaxID=93504 RepID=UPI00103CB0E8|nr:uncharacterized protein LOC114365387 [Ostrinia furnacalis]